MTFFKPLPNQLVVHVQTGREAAQTSAKGTTPSAYALWQRFDVRESSLFIDVWFPYTLAAFYPSQSRTVSWLSHTVADKLQYVCVIYIVDCVHISSPSDVFDDPRSY